MPTQPEGLNQSSSTPAAPEVSQVQGVGLLPTLDGADVTSRTIMVGLLGGVVSVGDFTLVIPAAALPQPATVTVRQADLIVRSSS